MKRHLLVLLVIVIASGCYSRLTGINGRLTFAYASAANVLDFNKPIAPGSRLDILAKPLAGDAELRIATARSSNPRVIQVVEIHPTHVVIQGAAAGTARLVIETDDGVQDGVWMHVAPPDRVILQHACTDDEFAVYPADSKIAIPFGLTRGDGQAVAGYGFHPVSIRPSAALVLDRDSRASDRLEFRTGKSRHRVAIRSTIDDAILGLALASNTEIDGIELDGFGLPRAIVGDATIAGFVPTVGGVSFCQARVRTRGHSTTPDICEVSGQLDDDSDSDENLLGLVRIKAKRYGWCEFEVGFPEALNGQGLTRRERVAIGKFPDSPGEGEERAWWIAPLLALLAPLTLLPFARRFVTRGARAPGAARSR